MEVLKKELALKGWSVDDLSIKIGISSPAIYSLLRGRSKPSHKTTKKLKDLGFSDKASLTPSVQIEV